MLHTLKAIARENSPVSFSPDGKLIAVQTKGTVDFWDTHSGEKTTTLRLEYKAIEAPIAFSPDGKKIACAGPDGAISLREIATGKMVASFARSRFGHALAFSWDGAALAATHSDESIRVWDVRTGKPVQSAVGLEVGFYPISVAISPDGRTVVTGAAHPAVWLWNVSTGRLIREVPLADAENTGVAIFSPDARFAAGVVRGSINVWDISSGKCLHRLPHDEGDFPGVVAFSADGNSLYVGHKDFHISCWDLTTNKKGVAFVGHTKPINSIAVSSNARMLLSASSDGTIRCWESASGSRSPGGGLFPGWRYHRVNRRAYRAALECTRA